MHASEWVSSGVCLVDPARSRASPWHISAHLLTTEGAVQAASELLIGDVLLACAAVTYAGGMPDTARTRLAATWHAECRRLGIPTSESFSVSAVLAQPSEVSCFVSLHLTCVQQAACAGA